MNTKQDIKPNISILGKIEDVENINDLIDLHSKYIDQITELITENRILKTQVIESDSKLNQEVLNWSLIQEIENLNQHIQYYKSWVNKNYNSIDFVVVEIDQNKEIENCKLIRELASKTKKISLLERRIAKLESANKTTKIHSFNEKIDVNEKIEQESQLKFESYDVSMKEHLSILSTDSQDSNKIIERLYTLISALKKNEIIMSSKLSSITILKEKLFVNNWEMKSAIQELEKEIIKLSSKEEFDQKLDSYIKEIESLKFRISTHEGERTELLQKLNWEISRSKTLEQKVYDLENSIDNELDEEKPIIYQRSEKKSRNKLKFSTLSNNPDKTFNMNDLVKEEDKDEEIIALQNKIIVFNQQHLNDMKELESIKSKEFNKLIAEKDKNISEYISRIEYLENECNILANANHDLHNRLEQTERILNDIETELISNPIKVVNEEILSTSEITKQKKNKKQQSKLGNSKGESVLSVSDLKDTSFKSDFKIKPTEFIIYPSKIISLLIESKRSEATAIIEIKRIQRSLIKINSQLGIHFILYFIAEKEQWLRQLEDEIHYSRREISSKEFNTFGNSKIKSEMNVIDENEINFQRNPVNDQCSYHERRIKELEYWVEELRIKEAERINELIQINRIKSKEIREDEDLNQSQTLYKAMIDWIAVLWYELCEIEIKDGSKRNNLNTFNGETSMTIIQTNRSLNQTQNHNGFELSSSVEMWQRLVIKYLNKTLWRILMNNEGLLINQDNNYVPNNEGDKAVWYLELLESQIGKEFLIIL